MIFGENELGITIKLCLCPRFNYPWNYSPYSDQQNYKT